MQAGHRVRYYTAADLVDTLYRGLADNSVGKVIDMLLRHDLIILDELGFAPLDDTGAQLTIEDDGTIYIGATNGEAAEAAKNAVNAIANPTMPEVGERYIGTVVKTTNFGAFVSLMPGKDGLLHISKLRSLAGGKRVDAVEDVVSVGQKIQVQIAEIDDRGKLSLVPVVEGEDAPAGDAEAAEDSE